MGDWQKPYARRRRYYGKTSTPPRWHQVVKVEDIVGTRGKTDFWRRVTMLCGYTYEWETIFGGDAFEHKSEVKTKSLRCSKCDKIDAARKGA